MGNPSAVHQSILFEPQQDGAPLEPFDKETLFAVCRDCGKALSRYRRHPTGYCVKCLLIRRKAKANYRCQDCGKRIHNPQGKRCRTCNMIARRQVLLICTNCKQPQSRHTKKSTTGLCEICLRQQRDREAKRCKNGCGQKLRSLKNDYCMACWKAVRPAFHHPCPDCGQPIIRLSERCRACAMKKRAAVNSHCGDCGIVLRVRGTARCRKCWLSYLSKTGGPARMIAGRATALKNRTMRSKAEQQCLALLDHFGLVWEEQVPIRRWIVDFLLSDGQVVIEVHGGYWHDRPAHHARDLRRQKELEGMGYTVIILRQDEMHFWWRTLAEHLPLLQLSLVRP